MGSKLSTRRKTKLKRAQTLPNSILADNVSALDDAEHDPYAYSMEDHVRVGRKSRVRPPKTLANGVRTRAMPTFDDIPSALAALDESIRQREQRLEKAKRTLAQIERDAQAAEQRRRRQSAENERARERIFQENAQRRAFEMSQRCDILLHQLHGTMPIQVAPSFPAQKRHRPSSVDTWRDSPTSSRRARDIRETPHVGRGRPSSIDSWQDSPSSSQRARDILETVHMEREEMAREREAHAAERERDRARLDDTRRALDENRESTVASLEGELARTRSQLDNERKMRNRSKRSAGGSSKRR